MKRKLNNMVLVSVLIILVFFIVVFGVSGLRWIIGAALLFFLPYYLVLDKFDLDNDEKVIFSFFIGLGITPSVVYYANLIIPSFRVSLIVAFIVILAVSLVARLYLNKRAKLSGGKES